MKMIQSVIIMLCIQPTEESTNPMKLQRIMIIEDPKFKAIEEKVEQCLKSRQKRGKQRQYNK